MELKYSFVENSSENVDYMLKTFVKEKPSWWSKTKNFINNASTIKEYFDKTDPNDIINTPTPRTVKSCPSMMALWKKTVIAKFPCDVFLETFDDGRFYYKYANNDIDISSHGSIQAPNYIGENFIVIKFMLGFRFTTDKKCNIFFNDPVLHNYQPYRVCPGTVEINPKNVHVPNINTLFEKKNAKYYFKADEALCMLTFSEDIKKFTYDPDVNKLPTQVKESRSFFGNYLKEKNK